MVESFCTVFHYDSWLCDLAAISETTITALGQHGLTHLKDWSFRFEDFCEFGAWSEDWIYDGGDLKTYHFFIFQTILQTCEVLVFVLRNCHWLLVFSRGVAWSGWCLWRCITRHFFASFNCRGTLNEEHFVKHLDHENLAWQKLGDHCKNRDDRAA